MYLPPPPRAKETGMMNPLDIALASALALPLS